VAPVTHLNNGDKENMSIAGGLLPSKGLPTQKRHDSYAPAGEGRFVILPNGMKMAAEWKRKQDVPEGHAVINIDYGRDSTEMGPVPVTHGDWTIVIPRGSDRVVPLQHLNILNDAITTDYFQKDLSQGLTSRSNRRFNFTVKKWPKTGMKAGAEFDVESSPITKEDLEGALERHEVIELDQN
jgi:hypothetical protein